MKSSKSVHHQYDMICDIDIYSVNTIQRQYKWIKFPKIQNHLALFNQNYVPNTYSQAKFTRKSNRHKQYAKSTKLLLNYRLDLSNSL